MQTSIRFTFDKVKFDEKKDVQAVVTLTAPKIDWQSKRAPIALVPVIDISGSMNYAAGPQGTKLDYVKKSVLKLIDHLQPGDYCGLVSFTTDSYIVSPVMEMTQAKKDELKAKVSTMHPMESTNFAGGMTDSFGLLNKLDLPPGVTLRSIIFTDGLANVGVATKRPDLMALLDKTLGKASFSCFGYGQDCDQELLRDMAARGKGNFAFIQNPDDASTAFARELGGLLSTYAKNIQFKVEPQGEHKITKVVSDVDVTDDNGKPIIKIPDILGEEEKHIVLNVTLAAQNQPLPRPLNVLEVAGSYDIIQPDGSTKTEKFELKGKVEFVKHGDEQQKATETVDTVVALAQLAEKQAQAESLANSGDYKGATAVMDWMEQDFRGRGLIGAAGVAGKLNRMVSSSQAMGQSAGYRSSMKSGAVRGMSTYGEEATADLGRLGVTSDNASTKSVIDSFKKDDAAAAAPEKKPEPPKGLSKKRSKRW